MRRAGVLELTTVLAACSGLLALLALPGWQVAVLISGTLVLLAPFVRHRLPAAVPWPALSLLAALAGLLLPPLLGTSLNDGVAASLASLVLLRRWGRASATDDRVTAVLALLLLVLVGARSTSGLLAGALLGWTVAAPLVAVLTTLESAGSRGSRRRRIVGGHLAWISLATVLVASLVFVVLPRVRPADLGRGSSDAHIGFSDTVALGDLGTLLDDNTPALRLRVPDGLDATYLRGLVLDTFDGRSWRHTTALEPAPENAGGGVAVRVQAEPGAGPVAFAPGQVLTVQSDPPGFLPDRSGSWHLQGPRRGVTYTAWVQADVPAPDSDAPLWRRLPQDLDPRILALADGIVPPDADALQAAEAVRAWLQQGFRYDPSPRDTQLEEPLTTFLLERRSGHCEYFAAAEAVLLRAAGHPARIVNGFAHPEPLPGGYLLVRQAHAHAWVEVAHDGRWHRVDATPGGSRPPPATPAAAAWWDRARAFWTERILAYDGSVQADLLRTAAWWVQRPLTGTATPSTVPWLGLGLLLVGAAIGLVGTTTAARRLVRRLAGERPARPLGRVARLHARARQQVARAGLVVPAALPPVHAARWLHAEHPGVAEALEQLAWLHYRVRYGGEDDSDVLPEARQAARALRQALRRR